MKIASPGPGQASTTPVGVLKSFSQPDSGSGINDTPPPSAEPTETFMESVKDSAVSWGTQGQKLGALALVAAGTSYLPVALMVRFPSMPIPGAIGISIGSMAALALEERYVGVGKKVGQLALGTLGAGWGGAKHLLGFNGKKEEKAVELKQAPATGAPPKEAILPSLLHAGQRKFLGQVPERTRAVEIGEGIGATVGTLACAYTVPRLVTALAGDQPLVGMAMSSMLGPLVGMVVGGMQENFLGVGRATGELVGHGFAAMGLGSNTPQGGIGRDEIKEPGALKKGFLKLNGAIAEPIVGFLVDTTVASNRVFAEEPVQNIHFQERPTPRVDRQRLVDNFTSLAGIYGPSGKEKLVGEELTRRMEALGFTVEQKADGTVIGSLEASDSAKDAPTVMLSAHQDTVEATNPEAIRNDGKRIYTDGRHILGADDRAGIAEILEGVESVLEQGLEHPQLKLVFPVDEERGLVGSSRLTPEDISDRPTLGFVVDALSVKDVHLTNDAVIVNPGSMKYQFSQEDPLVQVVFQSMATSGLKPRPIHAPILTGAGSDANTPAFNTKHVRSLAVGAGETNMHTGMEQIKIDDLEQAARHVVGYITNACDLKVEGDQIVPRRPVTEG